MRAEFRHGSGTPPSVARSVWLSLLSPGFSRRTLTRPHSRGFSRSIDRPRDPSPGAGLALSSQGKVAGSGDRNPRLRGVASDCECRRWRAVGVISDRTGIVRRAFFKRRRGLERGWTAASRLRGASKIYLNGVARRPITTGRGSGQGSLVRWRRCSLKEESSPEQPSPAETADGEDRSTAEKDQRAVEDRPHCVDAGHSAESGAGFAPWCSSRRRQDGVPDSR